ncbi:MAG: PEP-CTERM sorting domain-containing protein, partial [Akkermansiaceae bacterium]|nr:PEP-CTERM sorting domain-containing protein [Akkermansiaceae bacterium]
KNGRIIEIIPEPRVAALFTLMLGGGLFTRRRTRPASEPQSPTFVVRYSSFVIRNSTNPPS